MVEINCIKEIENTCELIKKTKNEFVNLGDASFPMKYLFKWSVAVQLKDACEKKFTGIGSIDKITERFEQEKKKDMEMVLKNLELNCAPMKDSTSGPMDNLTVQFSEKVSLKETPTETMSDQRSKVQGDFDIPGNARNRKQQSCNEIKKPTQKSLDFKPKINILEKEVENFIAGHQESERKIRSEIEEVASLKILNERLREQNQEMSHGMAVYQEEQTLVLDMLNSLPIILTQIDRVTNKDYLKEFKLPYKQNEFMNKCTKAIEAVIDGYIKMKASLLKSQQELFDKIKDMAEWTTTITSDTAEQMKVFHEQQQKTAIYKTDIQRKISEIEKLSFKNEELIEGHRTLEQQFYDIKILNKKVVEEKETLKKEFNDLQKR
ncbi:uncharacterized protein LOC143043025 [Mytilus galloprovincialis]|uniref:uncharacterized protein LOC143043025 n=1 Tax=Mytilus galloprovincialis TaxID=29158 RepID=UPI003F7C72A7